MTADRLDDRLLRLCSWPFDTIASARPSAGLGVAVSGGGDSLALLHLLWRHARDRDLSLAAVTVDHGLRPEAAEEAALVASFCKKRDIDHDVLTWRWSQRGNLQAAARNGRYTRIAEWARGRGISHVALGHTEDDVAETFVMRLSRRSGLDGLTAMAERREAEGITWLRPLLSVSRQDLRAYLTAQRIRWAEDPSNADLRFDRVKARHAVQHLASMGVTAPAIARSAAHLAQSRTALEHYAQREAERLVEFEHGDVLLRRVSAEDVPRDIQRRLLFAAIMFVAPSEYPPRAQALEDAELRLFSSKRVTIGGCLISVNRSGGTVLWRVAREVERLLGVRSATSQLWDGRWRVNGPHQNGLEVRVLGDAISSCAQWRANGLPRTSVQASPAIWRGAQLIAAPMASFGSDWSAKVVNGRAEFGRLLIRR